MEVQLLQVVHLALFAPITYDVPTNTQQGPVEEMRETTKSHFLKKQEPRLIEWNCL